MQSNSGRTLEILTVLVVPFIVSLLEIWTSLQNSAFIFHYVLIALGGGEPS